TAGLLAPLRDQWTPVEDLLDVLEADDARLRLACPAYSHPCQRADLPISRLAAFGLAMVSTVRAQVQPAYRHAAGRLAWADFEDVGLVVPGLRVIRLMHADGVAVVVDRDIHMPASGGLEGARPATAAGEQVNSKLLVDAEDHLLCHKIGRAHV